MLNTALYKGNYVSEAILYKKVIMMSETYAQNSKYYWESDMIFIEYDKTNMSEMNFIFALDRHEKL